MSSWQERFVEIPEKQYKVNFTKEEIDLLIDSLESNYNSCLEQIKKNKDYEVYLEKVKKIYEIKIKLINEVENY